MSNNSQALKWLNSLAQADITQHQAQVMLGLACGEVAIMTDAARLCGLSGASITGLADTLEKRGWLARVRVEDRRAVGLALCERGRREFPWPA